MAFKLFVTKQQDENNTPATKLRSGMTIKIQLDDGSMQMAKARHVRKSDANDGIIIFDLITDDIDEAVAIYDDEYIDTLI